MHQEHEFKVAFVGLPSSGKSSVINSLVFKRLLETGVCRTTVESNLLKEVLVDDENNNFRVIDLPGICDSEENDNKFNEITKEYVKDANLIIWVSDVNKAFITTHEVTEYNNLKKYLNDLTDETGQLYNLIIMLSKCNDQYPSQKVQKKRERKNKDGEIEESDEDSNISDLIKKVYEKFPKEDIILFNAYGRSYHHPKTSAILKKFVGKKNNNNYNTKFIISKYTNDWKNIQKENYYAFFKKKFDNFINHIITIDKLLSVYSNLLTDDRHGHIDDICNVAIDKTNFKYYEYIKNVYTTKYFKNAINNVIIRLIDYIFLMLKNPENLNKNKNFVKDYTLDQIYELFFSYFQQLPHNNQKIIHDTILYSNKMNSNSINIELLNRLYPNGFSFDKFSFMESFNKFIRETTDRIIYNDFYERILSLIKCDQVFKLKPDYNNYNSNKDHNKKLLEEIDQKFIIYPDTNSKYDELDYYLKWLENNSNNKEYILLNKLQILFLMFYPEYTDKYYYHENYVMDYYLKNHLFRFYNNRIHKIGIGLDRLNNNPDYKRVTNIIYSKIFSNILLKYDKELYYDFTPIDKLELLYK